MSIRTITPSIAHAASTDAGNAAMRKGGRTKWSRADYNAAVREYNRLLPEPRPPVCQWLMPPNPAAYSAAHEEEDARAEELDRMAESDR